MFTALFYNGIFRLGRFLFKLICGKPAASYLERHKKETYTHCCAGATLFALLLVISLLMIVPLRYMEKPAFYYALIFILCSVIGFILWAIFTRKKYAKLKEEEPAKMKKCWHCMRMNPEASTVCVACGAPLDGENSSSEGASSVSDSNGAESKRSKTRPCPNCGFPLLSFEKTCFRCGAVNSASNGEQPNSN